MLGDGAYTVFIADRGGQNLLGEVTNLATLSWGRIRDDISTATLRVVNPSPGCSSLLRGLRTIRHELVVMRDGLRVWEGPVTRIEHGYGYSVIDARDIGLFAARRALTRTLDYTGMSTVHVLDVCAMILRDVYGQNADDPYGLRVTVVPIRSAGDPRTAAKYLAWSRTVWEVVDSYARNGGIDYTVLGRQFLMWDVNCRVAETLRLTSSDFSAMPVVTEFGMELVTRVGVTNNDGLVNISTAKAEWIDYYGLIDEVVSNISEDGTVGDIIDEQARSTLDSRHPSPLQIRVGENTPLMPDAPVTIDQLVPGTHIPVEVIGTVRDVVQVQKLDRVQVTVEAGREQVAVSMTQRPTEVTERT